MPANKQAPRESHANPRVRFAPSPTGHIHIGTARAGLFNWLFARKHGGVFILRVEDTDKERSKPEYEEEIIEALRWLGLDWDEGPDAGGEHGPYRQSERTDIYERYLKQLLENKRAYYCYCTKDELEAQKQSMQAEGLVPQYPRHCRNLTAPPAGREPQTIRLKTPEKIVDFKDMVRGTVKFDTETLGDFVIAKDERTPLYNFANVVDDHEMEVTHVIRGEDHISNTPKQLVMQEALGFEPPRYAHLPLILSPDRKKLSKRFAETSLLEYREQGYLSRAVANFLVLMGWHPSPDPETKKEQEVWNLEELTGAFDIDRVQKAGAIFNEDKLQWLNREHMKKLSTEELEEVLLPFLQRTAPDSAAAKAAKDSRERLHKVIEAVRDRMRTLADFLNFADFFFELPDYPPELLNWSKAPAGETKEVLAASLTALKNVKAWEKDEVMAALDPLIGEKGKGNVLWPVRVALSGQQSSPDPFDIAAALGQEEALARINKAINKLSNDSLL